MELRDAIQQRRSVRSFKQEPVDVKEILELSLYAPNHKMTQPWRFVLIDRKDQQPLQDFIQKKKALSKGNPAPASEPLKEDCPSHMLAVIMNVNDKAKLYRDDIGATASLIQNFSLLAWEKGIGVVWKTPTLLHDEEFRDFFHVQENEEFIGLLHIGYPNVIPEVKERMPLDAVLDIGLPTTNE